MKKLGILFAVFFVMVFALHYAHSALAKEPAPINRDDLKAFEERINRTMDSNLSQTRRETDFYKTIATQYHDSSERDWTIILGIIAVLTLLNAYSIVKVGRTDKEAKELLSMARDEYDRIRRIREEAEASAKEAKSSEEKSKAIEHLLEGNRLGEQGKYEEAIAEYDKGLALDSKNAAAYFKKGFALSKLGKHEEAIRICGLGGDSADAVECYEKLLELEPENRPLRLNIARARQKRNGSGDADKARAILNNLLKEDDKDDFAAGAYALLGERDKMLALVRTLVAEKPELKQILSTVHTFEAYRTDPEFKAIVGG